MQTTSDDVRPAERFGDVGQLGRQQLRPALVSGQSLPLAPLRACHGAARPACADSRPFAVATYRNAGDKPRPDPHPRPAWVVFLAYHRGDTRGAPRGQLSPAHLGKLISAALGDGWTAHTVRHRFGTLAYAVERDLRARARAARTPEDRDDDGLHEGA